MIPVTSPASGTLAFHNPDRLPFDYDLVLLGDLNQPARFLSTPTTHGNQGVLYQYDFAATDPEGDAISYEALSIPSGAQFDAVAQTLLWTPTLADVGNHSLAIRATDPAGAGEIQQFTLSIDVPSTNRPARLHVDPRDRRRSRIAVLPTPPPRWTSMGMMSRLLMKSNPPG